MSNSDSTTLAEDTRLWRPDFAYSVILLIAAVIAVVVAGEDSGLLAGAYGWKAAGFFLVLGLLTIATGFPHPVFGYVSFDRVAQVTSILVLGPVDAAWVNGIASFIYPWQRLRLGVPLRMVLTAAFHNAGLMILVILGSGLLYQKLGGPIPLQVLDPGIGALLLVLVIGMQLVNDLGMMVVVSLRGGDPKQVFRLFIATVEYVSAAAGIVLAIALTNVSLAYFLLMLAVIVAGMIVIMQYATMRNRLEKIVEERTEELRVQAEEFERQATHDKLTGLPNRRYADDYLQQQIDLIRRHDHRGAIALADVDFFKRINDGYSHATGDRVLKRLAQILADGCRKSDFVARYGGEEFLLFFPDTGTDQALQVCSELRRAVQADDWSSIAPDLGVTISFGLAEVTAASRNRTILNDADERLHRAKREGRNRVIAA